MSDNHMVSAPHSQSMAEILPVAYSHMNFLQFVHEHHLFENGNLQSLTHTEHCETNL